MIERISKGALRREQLGNWEIVHHGGRENGATHPKAKTVTMKLSRGD